MTDGRGHRWIAVSAHPGGCAASHLLPRRIGTL